MAPLPGEGVPQWAPFCWGLAGTIAMCVVSPASLTDATGSAPESGPVLTGIEAWGC